MQTCAPGCEHVLVRVLVHVFASTGWLGAVLRSRGPRSSLRMLLAPRRDETSAARHARTLTSTEHRARSPGARAAHMSCTRCTRRAHALVRRRVSGSVVPIRCDLATTEGLKDGPTSRGVKTTRHLDVLISLTLRRPGRAEAPQHGESAHRRIDVLWNFGIVLLSVRNADREKTEDTHHGEERGRRDRRGCLYG